LCCLSGLLQIPNIKDICPVIIETLQPFYCDGAFFMAKEKKSFILYADQQGVFNQLPDEIAGRLIKHIFAYVNDEQPVTEELIINIAFEPIKQCLKRDLCRWKEYLDKQSVNGKKGGRPKKANESEITQAFLDKPKKADSVSVSVNDSVNVNEKRNIFKAPTVGELKSEFPNIDAESFHDFYTSKGWKIGKDAMKDWRAAARNWERRNNPTNNKPFTLKNKATLHDD